MRRFQSITVAFALALQAVPVSAFAQAQAPAQSQRAKAFDDAINNDPLIKSILASSQQPTQAAASAPAPVAASATQPAQTSKLSLRPYELSWEEAKRLIPGLEVVQSGDQIKIYGLIPSSAEIKKGMTFSIKADPASKRVRVGLEVSAGVKRELETRAASSKCTEESADCQSISESGLSGVSWTAQDQDAEVHWSHHERRTDPTLVGALKEHDLKIRLKSKATLEKEELARIEKEQKDKLKLLNCPTCLTSESKIEEAKQALSSLTGVADQLKLDVEKITLKIEDAELKLLLEQAKKVKPEEAQALMEKLRTFDTDKDDSKHQEQLARAYEQIAHALYSSKSEDDSVRAGYLSDAESILEEAKSLKLSKDMEKRIKSDLERVKVEQESNELIPLAKAGITQNTDLQERLTKVQEGYMRSCYGVRQAGSMTMQTGVKMDQEGSEKCLRATLLMERSKEILQMAVNEEVKRQQEVFVNTQMPTTAGNAAQGGPFSVRPGMPQGFAPSAGFPQGMGAPMTAQPGFGMPSSMGTRTMPGLSGFGQGQAPSMMGGQTPPTNLFPAGSGFSSAPGFGQAR